MEPLIVAVLVGIVVYIAIVAIIPRRILSQNSAYTRQMLQQIEHQAASMYLPADDAASILREQVDKSNVFTRAFLTLPGAQALYPRLLKANLTSSIDKLFITCLVLFLSFAYLFKGIGFFGIVTALSCTCLLAWWYINRRIRKRNEAFLLAFPDALDIIVRSVRSGYPLNAAVRMVADNMQAPVSEEFKKVADETAYGSPLLDALQRLAYRIDEPDLRFFVVVLSVQHEVGGNLAEVLSNLAGIIRRRRHLRMKLKAMTSEGRATAWVLGLLPLFEFVLIYFVSPGHLIPLFATPLGRMVLASAIGMVLLGGLIVKKLVNIEV